MAGVSLLMWWHWPSYRGLSSESAVGIESTTVEGLKNVGAADVALAILRIVLSRSLGFSVSNILGEYIGPLFSSKWLLTAVSKSLTLGFILFKSPRVALTPSPFNKEVDLGSPYLKSEGFSEKRYFMS